MAALASTGCYPALVRYEGGGGGAAGGAGAAAAAAAASSSVSTESLEHASAASPTATDLHLDDTPLHVSNIARLMFTERYDAIVPIAPNVTMADLTKIINYGKAHIDEMSKRAEGIYPERPSDTGLARSVVWLIDGEGVDFVIVFNKSADEPGKGDLHPPFTSGTRKFAYGYSAREEQRVIYVSMRCSDRDFAYRDIYQATSRIQYELDLHLRALQIYPRGVLPISAYSTILRKEEKESLWLCEYELTHKVVYVMKEANGGDVLSEMNKDTIPFILRLDRCFNLLDTVCELHENGMVHHDLKPENFIVHNTKRGSKIHSDMLLTDFGGAVDKDNITVPMRRLITPLYQDPGYHLSKASKSFDEYMAQDCWSCGIMLSECLFNFHPILILLQHLKKSADNPNDLKDIMNRILTDPEWYRRCFKEYLTPYLTKNPELYTPVIDAISTLLHPERSKRASLRECREIFATAYDKVFCAEEHK